MGAWMTTVDQLVRNFLDALNASIPAMRAARILDDQLIGFDDWGRLCDSYFNLLVLEPIRSSLPENQRRTFDLPSYETEYESYVDFSFIQVTAREEVSAPKKIGEPALLFRFLPGDDVASGFQVAETMRLDEMLVLDEMSWMPVPVENAYFTCIVPDGGGWRVIDELRVEME